MSLELRTYRTARKPRRCDMHGCRRSIQPGDRYVRSALPPLADVNSSEHWCTLHVCPECMTPDDRAAAGLNHPAEQEAAAFNAAHPIGTAAHAYPGARPEQWPDATVLTTRTRSAASALGGHTAVVWVEGHEACIALTHIDVTTTENTGDAR